MMTTKVAVMITTHNRVDDLERTLTQLLKLSPRPDEVLITADGCSDNTLALVQELYPTAVVFNNQESLGSIASRDRMLRSSRCDLVLSLDDDSYPLELDSIAILIDLFEKYSNAAIIHFPQRSDEFPGSLNVTDWGPATLTASFPNSGACYRTNIYLELPGFVAGFFHMYEEPDIALQAIDHGYDVIFDPSMVIRHHYSPVRRNEMLVHHRHARNELWSLWARGPIVLLLPFTAQRIASQLRYACRRGLRWVLHEPAWWYSAVVGSRHALRARRPVKLRSFFTWYRLLRKPTAIAKGSE